MKFSSLTLGLSLLLELVASGNFFIKMHAAKSTTNSANLNFITSYYSSHFTLPLSVVFCLSGIVVPHPDVFHLCLLVPPVCKCSPCVQLVSQVFHCGPSVVFFSCYYVILLSGPLACFWNLGYVNPGSTDCQLWPFFPFVHALKASCSCYETVELHWCCWSKLPLIKILAKTVGILSHFHNSILHSKSTP